MSLVALHCPACGGPITDSVARCTYCGVAIERDQPAPAAQYTSLWFVSFGRVGPSNRPRVAGVLVKYGIAAEVAAQLVAAAPSEVQVGAHYDRARELKNELVESGVTANIDERKVAVVVEPDRAVVLDAIGPNKAKVIFALREYVELDIGGAKQLVEAAPCKLSEPLAATRAQAFLAALVAAGATAHLE